MSTQYIVFVTKRQCAWTGRSEVVGEASAAIANDAVIGGVCSTARTPSGYELDGTLFAKDVALPPSPTVR